MVSWTRAFTSELGRWDRGIGEGTVPKGGAEKSGKGLETEVEPLGLAQGGPGRAWERGSGQRSVRCKRPGWLEGWFKVREEEKE